MSEVAALVRRGAGARKYLSTIVLSIQDALTYRASAVVWMLVDFIPSVVMILVWKAAYSGRTQVGGYSLSEMITYYLLTGIISGALTSHAEWTFNWEVRDGRLTPQLARPIHYPLVVICRETGWLITKFVVGLPVFLLLVYIFRDYFLIPLLSGETWLGLAVVAFLGYVILSEIGACLGCISLWTVEAAGMFGLWWSASSVLSGSLLPMELLPRPLYALAYVMPYRWTAYFPVRVLLGKISETEIWHGALFQLGWVAVLTLLLAVLWKAGTRRYEGWGG